ncbi:hypothetical protein J3R30DRAFT_821548 [Lentinula aciculospora]|uniref:Uncharacterized protein n=1 Tax=Lentinula aciculospora TaxID=153920 RepID=A0A9W9ARW6_9AGAR|nr:hypothetical protein J3R30DRAFT_2906848 [Lentinula aciculospora]KAJ4487606.1 hypothetical protein J3R30DRAFT_821548 [Lentinula aciculospora]
MPHTHSSVSLPQKRKMALEELFSDSVNSRTHLTISDIHQITVKPPKLRRIMAKYSDENLSVDVSFDNTDPSLLESVTESHSTSESIDTIIKHYRRISFRILRNNVLQRDATALMDRTAHIIDDIYDMNGEEDRLAWPLNVPPKESVIIPPKTRAADDSIHSTRVLRSSHRHSNSPLASKSSTPTPLAPSLVIPLPVMQKQSPDPSSTSTSSSTSTTLATPVIKTETEPSPIPHYKKLPSRGDSVQQRIAKLQADPWSDASKLTAKNVFCIGCQKTVCLDRRFDYYPGFWETHKRRCPFVQNGNVVDQVNSA